MSTETIVRPPGPRSFFFGLPLLGAMKRDTLGFLHQLHPCYGDVSYTRLAWERNYDFFHPDLVREVPEHQASSFIRWEHGTRMFAQIHGQNVVVTEGEQWQRQRQLLQPGFGTKRMAGYANLMVHAGQKHLDALPADAVQTLDFEHQMTQLTMVVILQTLFSSEGQGNDALDAERAVRKQLDVKISVTKQVRPQKRTIDRIHANRTPSRNTCAASSGVGDC